MVAIAAVTLYAGILTTVNGIAEVGESVTDYNFVRDIYFQGNQEAYDTYKTITMVTAEIGTLICSTYYAVNGGNVCFEAGTPVAAAAGLIAIEDIEVGALVWATNPETGETELKQVVQTFVNEASELVHLTTSEETITATPTHPFYVPEKGWVSAIDLRAGDILVTVNGEYVVLEKVQHEILESPVTVYNFEVEGFHTYHVGEQSLLVHNLCKQELVAGDKNGFNAKVSVGGEPKHRPHAHIFKKNEKIASVDIFGNVTDGKLNKAGRTFVKENLDKIANGIEIWWNYGR